jgi:succinate dehydrogenase / fumarate reductase, cytochrome b subunit
MSATAVNLSAIREVRFWQTTLGMKAIMAVTGLILFGFLCGHLLGNLQIFGPPEKINHYAEFLHANPALIWGARIGLLVSVGLHVWSALVLWKLQLGARPVKYFRKENLNSSYASRTMMLSGPIIAAFVIFHLLQFTFGAVAVPNFDPRNVHDNVVAGFQIWPVSAFYILALILLCYHLNHGLWSMFQSLGIEHPKYTPWLKRFAVLFSLAIALGNISIPVAVLAGVVTLGGK